jgi:uncharacterized protein (TIGR02145 family)
MNKKGDPVVGCVVRRFASTSILGAVVVAAALLVGCGGATDRFVDPRDGHAYSRVKIGNATWMGENLAWQAPSGSFCYEDDPANCATGGRLYTVVAAMNACPAGWHLSTDADWRTVEAFLGMPAADLDYDAYIAVRGSDEGTKLKEGGSSGLDFPMTGFAGLTNDMVTLWDGLTSGAGRTYIWTSTPGLNGLLRRRLEETVATVFRFSNPNEGVAIIVRCVEGP